MIAKKYRLSEREVKKVLRNWKPFFSRGSVLNILPNEYWYNRYAIVISWKSVGTAICRNFFRRMYYNIASKNIQTGEKKSCDIVCLIKKQTKLNQNDQKNIAIFKKEIHFLMRKIFLK